MIKGGKVKEILKQINAVMDENKLYLSELDAAIGDGDHGLNMNKGFNAVVEKIETLKDEDISMIVKASGMALVSNVGGASGPLYGTAFMKASMEIAKKEEINEEDFIKMLRAALEGIKMRGKGVAGEKTMIDTLEPAVVAGEKALEEGIKGKELLEKVRDAAEKGMTGTKEIAATKGRASYVGERSIGHQDAGATSMFLILDTIYKAI